MKTYKLLLIFWFPLSTLAQNYFINGTVTDNNGNPIIGANVIIDNTFIGTATDMLGKFKISGLRKGSYVLVASAVGYSKYTSELFTLHNDITNFNISLNPLIFQSDQVIVTAGKHEQNLIDLPVSASLIDASEFSEKNFTALDDALRYVSGVSVTLDQVSIRGSSGYSRGAGSRVLVAFDGIPIYTGDSGEIIWEQIPPYEIGRVEIIKGAASSLYGSTAIGGIINVIPKKITSNPLTFIKTYYGIYDKPSHEQWDWSGERRSYNGLSVSHSRNIGSVGISASIYRSEDYGYRQNDYDKRIGGYLKLNYNLSENANLNIWGTGYTRQRETFNFWRDLNNALSPPTDDLGDSQPSNRNIAAITYNHKLNDKISLSSKTSLYRTHWHDESESANNSTTYLYRTELKSIYKLNEGIIIISGLEGQKGTATSNIFGNNDAVNFGLFSQLEYEFSIPLKLTFGIRYDNSRLKDMDSESALSPKLGFNYEFSENTVLRASIGTGFRAPTLAEAFTSTTASGLSVKPNPNIKSEKNISFEFGLNQIISSNFNLDAAFFQSEYYDMIEPVLDRADANVYFSNITRARIRGFEINSLSTSFDNALKVKFGYTFIWPRDIELEKDLNYRSRHQLNISAEWKISTFTIGLDFRFLSRINEINNELVDFGIVNNGGKRVDIKTLDLRVSANLFTEGLPLRVFLNANNILNYNYVEMIGNIAPIRNYSVSSELLF